MKGLSKEEMIDFIDQTFKIFDIKLDWDILDDYAVTHYKAIEISVDAEFTTIIISHEGYIVESRIYRENYTLNHHRNWLIISVMSNYNELTEKYKKLWRKCRKYFKLYRRRGRHYAKDTNVELEKNV